jgi:hypothetical protein
MEVNINIIVFRDVTPCSVIKGTDVSEEIDVSVFRVEE